MNYIGGKYDVIDFLRRYIPREIYTFFDLFGGGATVSLNVNAKKVLYNDNNWIVSRLLEFLATTNPSDIYKRVIAVIKKYGLSKGNKEAYVNLRREYNNRDLNERDPLLLYLLICYGFEHQIRFNTNLEFNNPCGNSGFNDEMYEKLISYYYRVKDVNLEFHHGDYASYLDLISQTDFVYCDPPYLSTCDDDRNSYYVCPYCKNVVDVHLQGNEDISTSKINISTKTNEHNGAIRLHAV